MGAGLLLYLLLTRTGAVGRSDERHGGRELRQVRKTAGVVFVRRPVELRHLLLRGLTVDVRLKWGRSSGEGRSHERSRGLFRRRELSVLRELMRPVLDLLLRTRSLGRETVTVATERRVTLRLRRSLSAREVDPHARSHTVHGTGRGSSSGGGINLGRLHKAHDRHTTLWLRPRKDGVRFWLERSIDQGDDRVGGTGRLIAAVAFIVLEAVCPWGTRDARTRSDVVARFSDVDADAECRRRSSLGGLWSLSLSV